MKATRQVRSLVRELLIMSQGERYSASDKALGELLGEPLRESYSAVSHLGERVAHHVKGGELSGKRQSSGRVTGRVTAVKVYTARFTLDAGAGQISRQIPSSRASTLGTL